MVHEGPGWAFFALAGAGAVLICAPGAGFTGRCPVGIIGKRPVGAQLAAVVVDARAIREAARRAGGAVIPRRGKPQTASFEARFPASERTPTGVVRVDGGRVVVVCIKLRFVDPVDVSVGAGPAAKT